MRTQTPSAIRMPRLWRVGWKSAPMLIFLVLSLIAIGAEESEKTKIIQPDYRNQVMNEPTNKNVTGPATLFNGSVHKLDDSDIPNNGTHFLVRSAFGLPVNVGEEVDFKFGEAITAGHDAFSDLPTLDFTQKPQVAKGEDHKIVWIEEIQTVFAADPGFVNITWKDLEGHDVGPIRYLVGQLPVDTPVALFHTHPVGEDFIDDPSNDEDYTIPAPTTETPIVNVKNNGNIRWHWNTAIPQYDPKGQPAGNEQQGEFVTMVSDQGPDRNLYAQGRTGLILLEYRNENDQFKAMEIVDVRSNTQDIELSQVDIGQRLQPNVSVSQAADPKINRGHGDLAEDQRFVYRHEFPGTHDHGSLFAVRKTKNTRDIEIYWQRIGAEGVIWPYELHRYTAEWPSAERRQIYVRGDTVDNRGWSVQFPKNVTAKLMPYQVPTGHAKPVADSRFITHEQGLSLLRYEFGSPAGFDGVAFEVVESKFRSNMTIEPLSNDIGTEILDDYHTKGDSPISQAPGWIHVAPNADPLQRENRYAPEIYEETGQIFAVNEGMLELWWMNLSHGVQWPSKVIRYTCDWPKNSETIILARQNGTGVIHDEHHVDWQLYFQNDIDLPGFNPNDEHASPEGYQSGRGIFARRDDLYIENDRSSSKPFVLMQYRISDEETAPWAFRVWNVVAEEAPYFLKDWDLDLSDDHDPRTDPYETIAGTNFEQSPKPLDHRQESYGVSGPFWIDRKGIEWAMAAGDTSPDATAQIVMRFFYTWQPSYYFPDDTNTDDPLAWLDRKPNGTKGTPIDVTYTIRWPDEPELRIAETHMKTRHNIPKIDGQCSAELIYQQGFAVGSGRNANIIDPIQERVGTVILDPIPPEIKTDIRAVQESDGNTHNRTVFRHLPPHLMQRIFYNDKKGLLSIKGVFAEPALGQYYVLPNILTLQDLEELNQLNSEVNDANFNAAIQNLYDLTKDPVFLPTSDDTVSTGPDPRRLALTAGLAQSEGWVTLAFQNAEACHDFSIDDPIDVVPVYVGSLPPTDPQESRPPRLFNGEIAVIPPDCPFDEQLTLRYKADFAGRADDYEFQWVTRPPIDGGDPPPPEGEDMAEWNQQGWNLYPHVEPADGRAALEVIIRGANPFTLTDNWFTCRYRYVGEEERSWKNEWSGWSKPQIAEGWIKRVIGEINPITQRAVGGGVEGAEETFATFAERDANTIVSMISQAGKRWDGDIPLNCKNIDEFGLIQIYDTVLNRGMKLSIEAANATDNPAVNNALLLAAGRLADLYMLLGNEAFADAADPTIAFGTDDGQYGSEASSIHAFMNQMSSLLDEELSLLRGRSGQARDPKLDLGVQNAPVYNRLVWNFTKDFTGGETAYALNYNIREQDGTVDGVIDEADAKTQYPQGHGDTWGHYLTATKRYYQLLTHPNYTWVPRSEHVLVGGQPIAVDYLDERKFAKAAVAKARTGAEIVNMSYRQQYVEDPEDQWQGYMDNNPDRAWGVTDWASRAGQGTFLDWVVANALLPDVDDDAEHTGIRKIDRTTILELREMATAFNEVQSQLDEADIGLNPLGLAKDVVPFDISPAEISKGNTHFEQIYFRAVAALNNAIAVFNHANSSTQNLRRQADTVADFQNIARDRRVDFNSRLIEIFGTPYPEHMGVGKAYDPGYNGPDWKHYDMIDSELLHGLVDANSESLTRTFANPIITEDGGVIWEDGESVTFFLSDLGEIKPANWTGERETIGEAQLAKRDLVLAIARFEKGLKEYDMLVEQIEEMKTIFKSHRDISANQIEILVNDKIGLQKAKDLNKKIKEARRQQLNWKTSSQNTLQIANALKEALPVVVGLANDPSGFLRGQIMMVAAGLAGNQMRSENNEALAELDHQLAKETNRAEVDIEIRKASNKKELLSHVEQLRQLVRKDVVLRDELYVLQEMMHQAAGRYNAVLSRGLRLFEDRLRFEQQTADKTQQFRYKDMAFRIFRNDALQKYRAQFDLAAMYVYLAAKAYDYETNLLGTDRQSGQNFLTSIVRARAIGNIEGGVHLTGTHTLASALAVMAQHFGIPGEGGLKGQLRFNNPQDFEERAFKLRQELFRIAPGQSGDDRWRETLERHRVNNLRDIQEIARLAIIPGNAPEPGLVIPFGSQVVPGMNFFIDDLSGARNSVGGDTTFPPSYFAIKIRSVGVWFSNYNGLDLVNTPSAYLLPTGQDIMRVPGEIDTLRQWKIVDQVIPPPFDIGDSLSDPNWKPMGDYFTQAIRIRRFPEIPAGHDFGDGSQADNVKTSSTLLVGRSIWNTRWLLVIPGRSLLGEDPEGGLDLFINGRDGSGGVSNIRLYFSTYGYGGI